MKILSCILTAALLFAGCSQSDEEQVLPSTASVEFTVSGRQADVASDAQTSRAALENNLSRWEHDDEIALYARSYDNNPLASIAKLIAQMLGDGGKWATFTGNGLRPAKKDTYFAAYPALTGINSREATFTIGSAQTATDTPELMAVAKSSENIASDEIDLNFLPTNAFLCVTLAPDLGITSVRFEGCDGEAVAGTYVYNFADGTTRLTGTETSITVENPGTEFYITLPEMTLAKGYRLIFMRGEEQMVKSYGYGKPKEFAAGGIYNAPTVTEFIPSALKLGEVRSTYRTPDVQGLVHGKIYLTGNAFQGIPLALVEEVGVRYNVKGSTETVTAAFPTSQLDPEAAQKSFDLVLNVPTELYEVKMYLRDVFGHTYTTPVQEVGVLGSNPAVAVSATSSYDTDGTVAKNNDFDLGGSGFRMTAALSDISPRLVASARFAYSGGRTGEAEGEIGAVCTGIVSGLTPDEWTSYEVTGTITLGNGTTTFSDKGNTTVTGLPYYHKFDKAAAGWTLFKTEWANSGALELTVNKTDASRGYAVSPRFNIAGDTEVNYVMMGYYYCSLVGAGSCTIWVEPTNNTSTKSQTTAGHKKSDPNIAISGTYDGDTNAGSCTLSDAKPYMVISHNCTSGFAQSRYVVVGSFDLKYR